MGKDDTSIKQFNFIEKIIFKLKIFWKNLGKQEIDREHITPAKTLFQSIQESIMNKFSKKSDTGVESLDVPLPIKKLANQYFGPIVDMKKDYFEYNQLKGANIDLYPRTYASLIFLFSIFMFFLLIPLLFVVLTILSKKSMITIIVYSFGGAILGTLSFFIFLYAYPLNLYRSRGNNMNYNCAFAITHMASIASSGVSPYRIFRLMSEEKDFGEISTECGKIATYTELLGVDILSSMKMVMEQCPSPKFIKLLSGMCSIIESGGNLRRYLEVEAEQSLVEYSAEREKFIKSLSTLADLYIAIMIAAPLFLVATLSALAMLGGEYGGYTPDELLQLAIYVAIPVINTFYFVILEVVQPEI